MPRASRGASTSNAPLPMGKKRARSTEKDHAMPDEKRQRRSARVSGAAIHSPHFARSEAASASDEVSVDDNALSDAFDLDDRGNESTESVSEVEDNSDAPKIRSRRKAPSKKSKVNGTTVTGTTDLAATELWRRGVKLDAEPGTEVIIKKPKPRSAGKRPYEDHTIHPNTLLFLQDLKANNDREWLKMHDPDYRQSLRDFNSLLEVVTEKLTGVDETIPELPIKDITFRIYRDVRFSPDPTPYKPYFSAAWSRTGRKGPYAHYYLQIQPGHSFLGGGCWYPESQFLAAIRNNIDRRPEQIRRVLNNRAMRTEFLNNAPAKDADVIRAFCAARSNAESALKTKPKGYDGNHKDILLLRLRSFVIGTRLTDEEVTSPSFVDRLKSLLEIMPPFITYLNRVVMPDHDEEDDGDGDRNGYGHGHGQESSEEDRVSEADDED